MKHIIKEYIEAKKHKQREREDSRKYDMPDLSHSILFISLAALVAFMVLYIVIIIGWQVINSILTG